MIYSVSLKANHHQILGIVNEADIVIAQRVAHERYGHVYDHREQQWTTRSLHVEPGETQRMIILLGRHSTRHSRV